MTETLDVTTPAAPTTRPQDIRPTDGRTTPNRRVLATALAALGAGLATNSILGPLVLDAIDYSLSESLRNQLIGLDAVSLVLVAPLCALAAVLALRGRVGGAVLAIGATSYTAYMFVQYVVGPGYQRYPTVLLFHLALFVLAWLAGVAAWVQVRPEELPLLGARRRKALSWVAIGLAGFVVSRYLPALVGSFTGDTLTEEFRTEPAFFWTILLLDLGIVVPCAIGTGHLLRRSHPVAAKAVYGLVGWFALVPPSVAAMALAMLVNDDPNRSAGATVLFGVMAALCAGVAVVLFRPLVLPRRGGGR